MNQGSVCHLQPFKYMGKVMFLNEGYMTLHDFENPITKPLNSNLGQESSFPVLLCSDQPHDPHQTAEVAAEHKK